jgi:hypothetical protein
LPRSASPFTSIIIRGRGGQGVSGPCYPYRVPNYHRRAMQGGKVQGSSPRPSRFPVNFDPRRLDKELQGDFLVWRQGSSLPLCRSEQERRNLD